MSAKNTSSQLLVAGAIGGIAEAVVVQPLDMVKTRFQLNTSRNLSIAVTLRAVLHEGGFFRLYRGILPELAGMIPKSSLMLWSYEISKFWFTYWWATVGIVFAAGIVSGYFEAASVTPFQVVKVRLQAKEYLGLYKNSFDCLAKILKQEGSGVLWTGLGPTCWRNCVWNSIYFALMYKIKERLPIPMTKAGDLFQTLLAGTVGGVVATTFNAPFDVVKSRFQSQRRLQAEVLKYRWTLQSLAVIYLEEGAGAIYKGFSPKVLRMALGGGICMAAFELACYLMQPLHLQSIR